MVSKMEKDTVIILYKKGLSIRKIAADTLLARNTVKKYIREYLAAESELAAAKDPIDQARIQRQMTGAPKFNASARKNRVFTGELENRFWQLVEANRKRSEVVGQSEKQECNGAIIWRALREEGYAVSERTIRAKWAQYLRKRPEVFIRQEYEYGDRADFDFHQVKLKVSGMVAVYHQATISCPKSNHVFIALCPDETIRSVEGALIAFFEECGGVFNEITFDNLKPVVAVYGTKAKKVLTDEITRFAAYYGFAVNTCNARKGNEKGHVENSGKCVRRDLLSLRYEFEDERELKDYVADAMSRENADCSDDFAKEKAALRPLPPARYCVGEFGGAKANTYSFVCVKGNYYSVPETCAGRKLEWSIIAGRVAVSHAGVVVARHDLLKGRGEYSVQIGHFIETLRKKPGAIRRSLALAQCPDGIIAAYKGKFDGDPLGFLDYIQKAGAGGRSPRLRNGGGCRESPNQDDRRFDNG